MRLFLITAMLAVLGGCATGNAATIKYGIADNQINGFFVVDTATISRAVAIETPRGWRIAREDEP